MSDKRSVFITSEPENIVASMEVLRRRGAGTSKALKHEIDRLTDWREHVKANPLPFLLAAASIGYFLIPNQSKATGSSSAAEIATGTSQLLKPAESTTMAERFSSSIRAQLTTMAGRWLSAMVRQFVAQQLQSFKEHHDDQLAAAHASDQPVANKIRI